MNPRCRPPRVWAFQSDITNSIRGGQKLALPPELQLEIVTFSADSPFSSRREVDQQPPRGRTAICMAAAGLALLVILAFAPWWAAGKVFAPLDITQELYEPWAGGDSRVQVHNHFTSDAVTQYLEYRWVFAESFDGDGFVGWDD